MGKVIRIKNGTIQFKFNESEILQFKELKVGDKFIVMPLPGDDSGHGGFKGTHWIYEKIKPKFPKFKNNSHRLIDGVVTLNPPEMWIIRIK